MSDDTDHLKAKLARAEEALKAMTAERDKAVAAREITPDVIMSGVKGRGAVDDVINRALDRGIWSKDKKSGQIYCRDENGFDHIDKNFDKLTVGRFLNELRSDPDTSHYWTGGGQTGSNGGFGGSGNSVAGVEQAAANPWSMEGWDDMAQIAAYRADPVKAEQMAKAAGSRIGASDPRLAPPKRY